VAANSGRPRLGQPRRLTGVATAEVACNRDGSVLVVTQPEGLWVSHPRGRNPILLPMPVCNFVTVSPDGRWVAAAPWNRREMKVWELPDGREVNCRTNANPALAFTPDGRWLVMVGYDFYECLEVGTWRSVAHVPHEWELLFALAPSPDSRWVAFGHGRGPLLLCEVPTLRPVLTLDSSAEFPVCFSPDGARLLTRRGGGDFGLWDLRRIREELAPLGLDW